MNFRKESMVLTALRFASVLVACACAGVSYTQEYPVKPRAHDRAVPPPVKEVEKLGKVIRATGAKPE